MTKEAEQEHFEAPLSCKDDLIAVSNCFLMECMPRTDVRRRIRNALDREWILLTSVVYIIR